MVEVDKEFSNIKLRALALIKKFNKSTSGSSKLAQKTNLSLTKPAQTRWNCIYFVFERLITLRPHLSEIIDELGWDNLQNSDWRKVKLIFYGFKKQLLNL